MGYWMSDKLRVSFKNSNLEKEASPKKGLATTDNARFLRVWFEVDLNKIGINYKNKVEAINSDKNGLYLIKAVDIENGMDSITLS